MERIGILRENMSARQPLASLVKISELGRVSGQQKSLDPVTAAELRKLLSRPLAPLSELDQRERRRITSARLVSFGVALDQIRPAWIPKYAAAAAIALPPAERRLREFMLRELLRSGENRTLALARLAKPLQEQPEKRRNSILSALLRSIATLSNLPRAYSVEDVEESLMALVRSTNTPASPKRFALLALEVARAAEALSPGAIRIGEAALKSPTDALFSWLDDTHRAFLLRSRWGSFSSEITAVLWHRLWRYWREPASAKPTQQTLLKEAAWSEADQAIGRALQDSGRLIRSLDTLEAAIGGEAAARASAARGASNLILQWVRQAARLRSMECQGAFGEATVFDPALHESHEAEPGERVRILKPTVMRSNGSQQAVVLRGEVELE
jgi:hypothetical protein